MSGFQFCPHCGSRLAGTAIRFCGDCGGPMPGMVEDPQPLVQAGYRIPDGAASPLNQAAEGGRAKVAKTAATGKQPLDAASDPVPTTEALRSSPPAAASAQQSPTQTYCFQVGDRVRTVGDAPGRIVEMRDEAALVERGHSGERRWVRSHELSALTGSGPVRRLGYTGFYFWWWAVLTVIFGLGSLMSLGSAPSTGLTGLLVTGLAALYTRYLYRGGRWRMIFIVF